MPTTRAGIDVKFARARLRARELQGVMLEYSQSAPVGLVPVEGDEEAYRVVACEPPPAIAALLAGEAVHAARSGLDHLALQLVLANGGEPTDRTAFPIGKKYEGYGSDLRGALHGASQDARKAVRALNAYAGDGGDERFAVLSAMDNWDKHRLLHTLIVSHSESILRNVIDFADHPVRPGGRLAFDVTIPEEQPTVVAVGTILRFAKPVVGGGPPHLIMSTATVVPRLEAQFAPETPAAGRPVSWVPTLVAEIQEAIEPIVKAFV